MTSTPFNAISILVAICALAAAAYSEGNAVAQAIYMLAAVQAWSGVWVNEDE